MPEAKGIGLAGGKLEGAICAVTVVVRNFVALATAVALLIRNVKTYYTALSVGNRTVPTVFGGEVGGFNAFGVAIREEVGAVGATEYYVTAGIVNYLAVGSVGAVACSGDGLNVRAAYKRALINRYNVGGDVNRGKSRYATEGARFNNIGG